MCTAVPWVEHSLLSVQCFYCYLCFTPSCHLALTGGVAGFISESIQGVGGSVPLADGYLPAVYDVRSHAEPAPCTDLG